MGTPFMFTLPFSTVVLRRYLGWTAGEECWVDSWQWRSYRWLLGACGQCCVEYLWSSLVSFCFCCCLILFEYDNKCGSMCAFSVMFFCADSVQQGNKTGVDHSRSCQQGFCCSGICLTFCPTHLHILPFSIFRSECIWFRPAMWSSYYVTDSGQWKPYYDLLEPVMGHACPLWRFQLCKFSSLLWTFLVFLH